MKITQPTDINTHKKSLCVCDYKNKMSPDLFIVKLQLDKSKAI